MNFAKLLKTPFLVVLHWSFFLFRKQQKCFKEQNEEKIGIVQHNLFPGKKQRQLLKVRQY